MISFFSSSKTKECFIIFWNLIGKKLQLHSSHIFLFMIYGMSSTETSKQRSTEEVIIIQAYKRKLIEIKINYNSY